MEILKMIVTNPTLLPSDPKQYVLKMDEMISTKVFGPH